MPKECIQDSLDFGKKIRKRSGSGINSANYNLSSLSVSRADHRDNIVLTLA